MGRGSGYCLAQPDDQALKGSAGSTLVSGFDEFPAFAGRMSTVQMQNATRLLARRCGLEPGLDCQG